MSKRVAELEGAALDWWVAKGLGWQEEGHWWRPIDGSRLLMIGSWRPSRDWNQAGPIIERERIGIVWDGSEWEAYVGHLSPNMLDNDPADGVGPIPLIAAMRAFVTSRYGEEVPA